LPYFGSTFSLIPVWNKTVTKREIKDKVTRKMLTIAIALLPERLSEILVKATFSGPSVH
jgi:hypothetical protein